MYSEIGSDLYREHIDPLFDRENAYEAYYVFQFSPAFRLTPRIQDIIQPGELTIRENVFVLALRARIIL